MGLSVGFDAPYAPADEGTDQLAGESRVRDDDRRATAFFFGFGFITCFLDFADVWVMSLVLGGIVLALVASVESARHFWPTAAMTTTPFVDGR